MAKAKVKKANMSQKLSTGSAPASGMDLKSKLEKAAGITYKGYNQGSVRHGAHGILAGTGGKKSAKIPNAG